MPALAPSFGSFTLGEYSCVRMRTLQPALVHSGTELCMWQSGGRGVGHLAATASRERSSWQPSPTGVLRSRSMVFTLRAHVRGGRLVLDEPIDLPEGSEVDLVLADEQDDLDEEDRARLHAALDRARTQVQRGETIGKDEFLARLRAQG